MAGWHARLCKNSRDTQQAGPALPCLFCASLRAPYSTRGSEQAVERVLPQETGSQKRMITVAIITSFMECLGDARHCLLSTSLVSIHLTFTTTLQSTAVVSILWVRKLKHKEVEKLAPGHTAIKLVRI